MGKKLIPKTHMRDNIVEFIHRLEIFLQKPGPIDENQIKIRLEKLEEKWKEFEEIQREIEFSEGQEENMERHRQVTAEFEERYFEVRAGLQGKLPTHNATHDLQTDRSNHSNASGVHSYVRLPQINLPEFDGNFENWLAFHDTFKALIDSSPELSDIQKFHYLRASVKGDALKQIDSYPMSEANYRVAWAGLVSRFSNAYLLKKRHMNSLLEYPKMKKECAAGIHDLIDCFERNTKILDQLGEQTNGWGAMLTHLIVSKLDDATQKLWEEHATHHDNPCYTLLVEFLKNRTRVLEAVSVDQRNFSSTAPTTSSKLRPLKVSVNTATGIKAPTCTVCKERHYLTQCPTFNKLDVDKRLRVTNAKRLCSNCLGRSHMARDCPSKFRCRTCSKKHHTLLHPGFPASGSGSSPVPSDSNAQYSTPSTSGGSTNSGGLGSNSLESSSVNMAMGYSASHVFLLTVLLEVKDHFGKMHLARALLDCGSQANLISEQLCQLLKLPRRDKKVEIRGIGQSKRQSVHEVSTIIASRVQDYSLPLKFLVLERITDDQPSISLPLKHWNLPASLKLADPDFAMSGPIDMILGSQFFYEFHLLDGGRMQIKKFDHNLPSFVSTVFGWVAAGEIEWNGMTKIGCNVALADPLEKAIEKFWNIEEIQNKIPRSQEEEDCESHFLNTISRDRSGRYVVQYPKNVHFHDLIGESKSVAMRRFHQLEKRLEKDSALGIKYNDFLKEYLEKKHMMFVGEAETISNEDPRTICYLPHHPVIKESSSTTKLRVVFDGSAKTTTNRSLNDALLTGPVVQDDLFDLVIRFRKHSVALVADIEKMYRQIRVHPNDACLQRILWRFTPTESIKVYELQTVTYGLSPSSFIATRVLQQLAVSYSDKYKLASRAALEDFYMDDFLSGTDCVENATQLVNEMQSLMKEGGFQLRKWSSSHREVLKDLPPEYLETTTTLNLEQKNHVKTLGIVWETESDHLSIDVKATINQHHWTKRKIFSAIAQLYDPLGLISPVIMWAKIRMQHLWTAALGWDDTINSNLEAKWNEFYDQLTLLKEFKVPRFLMAAPQSSIQFHVFCDASEAGYGACIYARSTSKEGKIENEIIASKSRVAPIKRISLPRLELCAALLGAKLYARVSAALRMEGNPCWFWSDSMVTLHWIKTPPNTWQTFIGNRTSEIQLLTHGHNWNHVKGSDNPADYVSRGMLPKDFLLINSWRVGPAWLTLREDNWPKFIEADPPSEETLERRKTITVVQTHSETFFLFHRYSSFTKLVRITAFVLRFYKLCRHPDFKRRRKEFLTLHELKDAKEALVKCAQQERFADELKSLKTNKMVPQKSPIKLLHPFIDETGMLRVGGRLQRCNEAYSMKHPMIIPNNHPLSRLIAVQFHALCLHSGPRMTLATIRQQFWPINGSKLANHVCRKCPKCFRNSPTPINQTFGQLPKTRTIPSRPFSITGVDYCGPVHLKPTHRRAASRKAYIAVFVCFSTKAVHLELVCDLTTEAFIATLRRFVARRGLPTEIHSDNGTNFVGAKNTLNELYNMLNSKKHRDTVTNECTSRGIVWNFIPPRAPNFGGLWEAAVKTAKTSLTKTIGTAQLSFEDFSTVLTQIEANMNSRPLTPLSEDPREYDVLTPGHFLIGSPLISMPEPDYSHTPINRLRHYQQLQRFVQDHWVRWRREYLTELNNQRKRTSFPIDIRVGQMVLVHDDNKPSVAWPLGRIESTHPGEDGVVRVVTIKTISGSFKRPICKIFPLPFDRDVFKAHQEHSEPNENDLVL